MFARKMIQAGAALSALAFGGAANAAIISIDPFAQFATEGDEISISISVAFDEATVGGAFDLFYDATRLEFVSFEFDSDFINTIADPAFTVLPDNCFADGAAISGCNVGDGELNAIGFGNFAGIEGIHVDIATIVFVATGSGTADIGLGVNDSPFEGFFSALTGNEIDVVYNSAQVFIQAVPVPAALWMLFSALGLTGLMRRPTQR